AMRSMYGTDRSASTGAEAFYNEANTAFAGAGTQQSLGLKATTSDVPYGVFDANTGTAMATSTAEGLTPAEMGFSIEKVTVSAKTRALKAEYSMELAQDL
ncbi:MAG: ATP-binding protein, partial [bacterium]